MIIQNHRLTYKPLLIKGMKNKFGFEHKAAKRRFVAKRMFELLPHLLSRRSDFYLNKKQEISNMISIGIKSPIEYRKLMDRVV